MIDHYFLSVRKQYPDRVAGDELEITILELADIFRCSGRNANLVLRRMEEAGWIEWKAGRGRGHRSRLRFLVSSETVALEVAQTLVRRGDIRQAFDYLESWPHLQGIKELFANWLDSQFGYRSEVKNEQNLDTLRIPYSKRIQCLDPARHIYVAECHMVQQIFDGLVRYNAQTGTIENRLAYYWSKDEQQKAWTFYLRKRVYFHHGREMTSADIQYTLERIKDGLDHSPFRWLFADIEHIELLGPYALRISLARPNPLFLQHLSMDRAAIVPRDMIEELGEEFRNTPVGTGPFKVIQHCDNKLVLQAYDRYFDRRAHLDRVEIWYTPELLHTASGLEPHSYQMRYQGGGERDTPNDWKKIETFGRNCSFMTFNMHWPGPQQRLEFRLAVHHGIDRRQLLSPPEWDNVTLAQWFYEEDTLERSETDGEYDPLLARRLVAESGYAGERLTLAYTSSNEELARRLSGQLEALGIRTTLQSRHCSMDEYTATLGEAHLSIVRNNLDYDVEMSILELFMAENSMLRTHFNAEMKEHADWLIHRLYQEGSPLTRSNYLNRLRKLFEEQRYLSFLFHHKSRMVFHPSLKNVSLNALGWVQFRDLWFEPAGSALTRL